jgi:hypothetical protein
MKNVQFNKSKDSVLQVLCPQCARETRHTVIQSVDMDGREEDGDWWYAWIAKYQVIECQGCQFVSFRSEQSNSEDEEPETGHSIVTERVYPLRSKNTLVSKEYWNLPYSIKRIHREVIDAFNAELFTLCAAGLRSIIEAICTEEGVNAGPVSVVLKDGTTRIDRKKNLEGKIAGLHEKGILTKQSTDVLHELRFLGNDALHELSQPSREELALAIEIIEHMLDGIYEVPVKAAELRSKATTRKKKQN